MRAPPGREAWHGERWAGGERDGTASADRTLVDTSRFEESDFRKRTMLGGGESATSATSLGCEHPHRQRIRAALDSFDSSPSNATL